MQATHEGSDHVLRLDPGEEIPDRLGRYATAAGIRAGVVVMGIGQLVETRIGFWNGQEYRPLRLESPVELLALHGTVAEADGQASLHLHVAVGDAEHRVLGGHLLSARVGLLAEVHLRALPGKVFSRPMDESVGLRRLELPG